jgi:hypothetical protein
MHNFGVIASPEAYNDEGMSFYVILGEAENSDKRHISIKNISIELLRKACS